MAKEITMPALSPSMAEGTLVKWLKKEGDEIKKGDIIAEVETDKATMDLESFDAGTLLKIVTQEGSRVPVNGRIAFVGQAGEIIDEALLKSEQAPVEEKKEEVKSVATVASSSQAVSSGKIKASPLAKKIAKEKGISLEGITGTGPGGRIVKKDVLSAEEGVVVSGGEQIQLSNMRRTIARRMTESKTQVPHFYLEMEADAEELLRTRASLNASLESGPQHVKLTLNDFVLKACVEALKKVPQVNASYEGETMRLYKEIHISFAAAIKEGLITPVVRDAHEKSLIEISKDAKMLSARAKEGDLKPEEYTGATFTVSNLGMFGIERFSAIINPPQAAILAVGNIIKKPVVDEKDQIVIGQRVSLTLSCDHRVIDGAIGATFLKELKNLIENPAQLLI